MHNIYVDTIKIIKYLKILQHVSNHRGSIIRETCIVFGQKLQEWFYRVRWHGQGQCYGSIFWPVLCVCVWFTVYEVNYTHAQRVRICWSTFKYFIILIVSLCFILCISWTIKCLSLMHSANMKINKCMLCRELLLSKPRNIFHSGSFSDLVESV